MQIDAQEMVEAKIYSYLFFYLHIIRQWRQDIRNEVSSSVDKDKHMDHMDKIKAEIKALMRKLYHQLRDLQVIDKEASSSVDTRNDTADPGTSTAMSRINILRSIGEKLRDLTFESDQWCFLLSVASKILLFADSFDKTHSFDKTLCTYFEEVCLRNDGEISQGNYLSPSSSGASMASTVG